MQGRWLLLVVVLLAGCSGLAADEAPTDVQSAETPTDAPTDTGETPTTNTATSSQTVTDTPEATDSDGDGLSDERERELGTDPDATDSDGDGLSDGEEVSSESNPTKVDTDDDGLDDARELELGTSAAVVDSDFDRLNDGKEVELGANPNDDDSDDDGVIDGREVEEGMDPLKKDTDGDGMGDKEELRTDGRDPTVADAPTPTPEPKTDSDGDGLSDEREQELGTDPRHPDTDEDGWLDGWEVKGRIPRSGQPLPGFDPLHKDVYLVVYEHQDVSDQFMSDIRTHFAEMPVDNPDGNDGIRLYTRMETNVDSRWTGTSGGDHPLNGTERNVPVRTVRILTEEDSQETCDGDSGCSNYEKHSYAPSNTDVVVHEVLHSIIRCKGNEHTEDGWMEPQLPVGQFMSSSTEQGLDQDGLSTNEGGTDILGQDHYYEPWTNPRHPDATVKREC